METRAPYALIGLFVLASIATVFGFVYWLHNTSSLSERTVYQVRFENSVSGLLTGAAVLFNGIRVGEVTELRLNPENPRQVTATIAVDRGTPVRADTQAGLDFQGLTGIPVIALQGGSPAPTAWTMTAGQPPVLVADPLAAQSMTQAARVALQRLEAVMAENAEPLRSTIANLNTFAGALARNSDRLDGIIAGLERLTGGGAASAPQTVYDLIAPRKFPALDKTPRGQLAVPEPTAVIMFETRKIIIRPSGSEGPTFANAQWSDSVPKLVQAKIIESFENANLLRSVSRATEGLAADYQLLIDIRSFQISMLPDPMADVEFGAKIVANGKILNAKLFHATVPTKAIDAPMAAAALSEAFGKAATELVLWSSGVISNPAPTSR